MGLFKRKKKEEDLDDNPDESEEDEESSDKPQVGEGNVSIQMAKLGSKVESLLDIRKSYSERFTLISEQIGELRGMIMDASKQIQTQEINSARTVEMVKEVQPDKFMSMLRRQEGAVEAIKAALESKDAIMKDITEDMKKMRKQMSFYRGIEQVIKLNQEIKKDIFSIKKVQAIVEQHSDKVESMFVDLQKKYGDIDSLTKSVHDIEDMLKKVKSDADKLGLAVDAKVPMAKHADLVKKFEFFATNAHIAKLEAFTQTIDTFQSKNNETLQSIEKVKEDTQALQEKFQVANIEHLTTDIARLNNIVALLDNDMTKAKDSIAVYSKDKADTQAVIELVAQLKKDEEFQHKSQEDSMKFNEQIKEQFGVLDTKKASKKDLNSLEEQSSKQKDLLLKTEKKLSDLSSTLEKMEKDHEDLLKVVNKTKKEMDSLQKSEKTRLSQSLPVNQISQPQINGPALILEDGVQINSIEDLQLAVMNMSPVVFARYVSANNNIFADWIQNKLGIRALAKVLRNKLYRDEFLHMLKAYLHVMS